MFQNIIKQLQIFIRFIKELFSSLSYPNWWLFKVKLLKKLFLVILHLLLIYYD